MAWLPWHVPIQLTPQSSRVNALQKAWHFPIKVLQWGQPSAPFSDTCMTSRVDLQAPHPTIILINRTSLKDFGRVIFVQCSHAQRNIMHISWPRDLYVPFGTLYMDSPIRTYLSNWGDPK